MFQSLFNILYDIIFIFYYICFFNKTKFMPFFINRFTSKNETNEKISKYLKNINDNIILYINHISALESKKQNNKIKKIKTNH